MLGSENLNDFHILLLFFFFKYNLKESIDETAEWLRQLTAKGTNKNIVTT